MTPTKEQKTEKPPRRKRRFDRVPGPSILEGLDAFFAETYGKNVRFRAPRQYVELPDE